MAGAVSVGGTRGQDTVRSACWVGGSEEQPGAVANTPQGWQPDNWPQLATIGTYNRPNQPRLLTRALFGQQGSDVAAVGHQARQVQGGEAAPAGGGGAECEACRGEVKWNAGYVAGGQECGVLGGKVHPPADFIPPQDAGGTVRRRMLRRFGRRTDSLCSSPQSSRVCTRSMRWLRTASCSSGMPVVPTHMMSTCGKKRQKTNGKNSECLGTQLALLRNAWHVSAVGSQDGQLHHRLHYSLQWAGAPGSHACMCQPCNTRIVLCPHCDGHKRPSHP